MQLKLPFSRYQLISIAWILFALVILIAGAQTHWRPNLSLGTLIPDASLREQAIAALIGSIFGALLGSMATTVGILVTDRKREKSNRDHERRVKHYNSVVKLQRQMNVVRGSMEDNTSALKSIIEAADLGVPTLQRPIEISIDETHFDDLYDIDLINMIHQLYYDIRRLNLDSVNLTRALDTLAQELFSGAISHKQYKSGVSRINPEVIQIRQYLLYTLDHELLDILSYVRICVDRDASTEMKERLQRMLQDRQPITDQDIRQTRQEIIEELKQSEIAGEQKKAEIATYE